MRSDEEKSAKGGTLRSRQLMVPAFYCPALQRCRRRLKLEMQDFRDAGTTKVEQVDEQARRAGQWDVTLNGSVEAEKQTEEKACTLGTGKVLRGFKGRSRCMS